MRLIMNEYLLKDIRTKLLKFSGEQISKDELDNIKNFSINNYTYSGVLKGINLNELENLPNLESLTLQHFQISDQEIKALENLRSLKDLFFSECSFNAKEFYEFPNLSSIEFDICNYYYFPKIKLPKIVYINYAENGLNLKDFYNFENIEDLTMLNVKKITGFNFISQMRNLKNLNIDGSKVDDKNALKELADRIPVSHNATSNPII